jgi:hypothetical protein
MSSWDIPDNADEDKLVEDWIRFQHLRRQREPFESVIWAHAALDDICDRNPRGCLSLIRKIVARDSSDMIISALAAGPLEDLLTRHGPSMIDDICSASEEDPRIGSMLSGVWRSTIDPMVWDRVQQIVARSTNPPG